MTIIPKFNMYLHSLVTLDFKDIDITLSMATCPHHTGNLLTLGAHAQRGLRYLVCLSVREIWHYRHQAGI